MTKEGKEPSYSFVCLRTSNIGSVSYFRCLKLKRDQWVQIWFGLGYGARALEPLPILMVIKIHSFAQISGVYPANTLICLRNRFHIRRYVLLIMEPMS